MNRDQPTFYEHDTALSLWLMDPKDPAIVAARDAVVANLRARGFSMRLDAKVKEQYPSISRNFHEGSKGKLEVKIELGGRHLQILFFQNVVRENKSGGQHDFGRRHKMPYLIGKQYEVERAHIAACMRVMGLPALQLEDRSRGMALIERRREELCDFHGNDFYDRQWESYNIRSYAGRALSDGDTVYFRNRSGRMQRGICFRALNNMWLVLLPCRTVLNIACFELAHRQDIAPPPSGRWFHIDHRERKIHSRLKRAIDAQDFERAALVRDAIKRDFGTRVSVNAAVKVDGKGEAA